MRKIFLFLILISSFAFSAIDECRTDIYFANGILTSPDASKSNTELLRNAIIKKFGLDYYNKDIGKVDYAYNRTIGEKLDLWESAYQILDLQSFVDAGYTDHNYNSDKTLKM